jgi:glycosyltransferase involved in cell wall biosynthesis
LRITHLNTYDVLGGAARAAYRLHKGLIGAGRDSRMVVLSRGSVDPTVIQFDPPRDPLTRIRRGLRRRLLERATTAISSRPSGLGFFTDDRSQHGADVLRQLPPTDILNLHWVDGFIDFKAFFRKLPRGLPIVWTLHGMNPVTGGCHHAADCVGYLAQCGACPQLKSASEWDISREIWDRKRQAYAFLSEREIALVTPSRWLAGKVKESSLGRRFRLEVIPNGVDTGVFRPRSKEAARGALGLAADAKIVLFASHFSGDSYKGFPTLLDAFAKVRMRSELVGLTAGLGDSEQGQKSTFPIKSLGFIKDEERMSLVYSAADLFVLPSFQDNFPNAALEALACGVPIVASNVGGIPEIVREGLTGVTVAPGDSDALACAMDELLAAPARRSAMSLECRRIAVEEYSLEIQAGRYAQLYEELLRSMEPKATDTP